VSPFVCMKCKCVGSCTYMFLWIEQMFHSVFINAYFYDLVNSQSCKRKFHRIHEGNSSPKYKYDAKFFSMSWPIWCYFNLLCCEWIEGQQHNNRLKWQLYIKNFNTCKKNYLINHFIQKGFNFIYQTINIKCAIIVTNETHVAKVSNFKLGFSFFNY